MKTTDLIRLEDEVKEILIVNKSTRNDDMYLYYVYCCRKFEKQNIDGLERECLFSEIFRNEFTRKEYKICTCGSVKRVRAKIQASCPELASDRVKKARAKEEEEYKEYARL